MYSDFLINCSSVINNMAMKLNIYTWQNKITMGQMTTFNVRVTQTHKNYNLTLQFLSALQRASLCSLFWFLWPATLVFP